MAWNRYPIWWGLIQIFSVAPSAVQQPSARLLCTNLPQEVTDDVLSVLFQQYVNPLLTLLLPFRDPQSNLPFLPVVLSALSVSSVFAVLSFASFMLSGTKASKRRTLLPHRHQMLKARKSSWRRCSLIRQISHRWQKKLSMASR